MIRLNSKAVQSLIQVLTPYLEDQHAELRLYGSRALASRKGGDIDLLLIVDNVVLKQKLNEMKHYILAEMKMEIGDQKIDLTMVSKEKCEQDLFLRMILPTSVLLKKW